MEPPVERLVRLMVLLPSDHRHELYERLTNEGDTTEVMSMRWFVGDAAKGWPPAGPRNLASAVLTVFCDPSDKTLALLSDAITDTSAGGTGIGTAWVEQVRRAAIDVLACEQPLEDVLAETAAHWTLQSHP